MRVIIDRFEASFAVCEDEDGTMLNIEKTLIPIDSNEGDVLDLRNGKFILNKVKTEKRRREIENICKDLWK